MSSGLFPCKERTAVVQSAGVLYRVKSNIDSVRETFIALHLVGRM